MDFRRFFRIGAVFIALIFFATPGWSQAKSKDELEAEREVLRSEMRSENTLKRKEKFKKLTPPNPCGVSSVDQLTQNSTEMLMASKDISEKVPEMYKRVIGETVDGVTEVTVSKPKLEDVVALANDIAIQVSAVAETNTAVQAASSEIASLPPLQAPKATKSLNYTKDVMGLLGPELDLNQKVIRHLITTIKSNKNY